MSLLPLPPQGRGGGRKKAPAIDADMPILQAEEKEKPFGCKGKTIHRSNLYLHQVQWLTPDFILPANAIWMLMSQFRNEQFAAVELCSTPAKYLLGKQRCDAFVGSMNRV